MSKKYRLSQVFDILQKKGYKLVSQEYLNAHQKLEIECPKHGIFLMRFCSIVNSNQKCPKCSHKSTKYTVQEVRQIINKKGFKLITQDYINNNQKLEIECPKHGIFKKTLDGFNQSVSGCIECSKQVKSEKRKNNYQDITECVNKEDFELITKESEYKNNKTKLEINCIRHGIFKIKYNDFSWSWQTADEKFNWNHHSNNQLLDYANVGFNGVDAQFVFKTNCPWRIVTPPGWSVLQLPLFYHFNKQWSVLPGIVDTDIHHEINQQVLYHGNGEEFFIGRGSPFVLYIPFRRSEKLKHSIKYQTRNDKKKFNELSLILNSVFRPNGLYRKNQRNRDKLV
jgi:hypothetical protein